MPDLSTSVAAHELLDLAQTGRDTFAGPPMLTENRVFGGLVLGQATAAANRTVPADRYLRAVHAEFLREGNPSEPIHYEVTRLRDGRTYTRRQIVACQRDQVIFTQTASYGLDQSEASHQRPAPPAPERPEDLPAAGRLAEPYAWPPWLAAQPEIDVRVAPPSGDRQDYGAIRFWYRYQEPLPDDPQLHGALWLFLSDLSLLASVRLPHEHRSGGRWLSSSLDHACWLHRPVWCTSWLRVDQISDRTEAGFGVATAKVFDLEGHHVSTIAQHGVLRRPRVS